MLVQNRVKVSFSMQRSEAIFTQNVEGLISSRATNSLVLFACEKVPNKIASAVACQDFLLSRGWGYRKCFYSPSGPYFL